MMNTLLCLGQWVCLIFLQLGSFPETMSEVLQRLCSIEWYSLVKILLCKNILMVLRQEIRVPSAGQKPIFLAYHEADTQICQSVSDSFTAF